MIRGSNPRFQGVFEGDLKSFRDLKFDAFVPTKGAVENRLRPVCVNQIASDVYHFGSQTGDRLYHCCIRSSAAVLWKL